MNMRFFCLPVFLLLSVANASVVKSPSRAYCDFALKQCDRMDKQMPDYTAAAEIVVQRVLKGGVFGVPSFNHQLLCSELAGRAGGFIRFGFDRSWKTNSSDSEKAYDVAFLDWERAPDPTELAHLRELKKQGVYIIAFGRKTMPALAEYVTLCDVFFDTGLKDDCVVTLSDGTRAGRANHYVSTMSAWVLMAEMVSAFTRQGKMPTMYRSMFCEDAATWNNGVLKQGMFHDDLTVEPIPAGELGKAYVEHIREYVKRFRKTQLPEVGRAADLLHAQVKDGSKALVLTLGHMPYLYVGFYEDARWAKLVDFGGAGQKEALLSLKPEGRQVLRLGYFGESAEARQILQEQKLRLIYICGNNPRPGFQIPEECILKIDMCAPFGDSCVTIKDYPIPILPASGVMQVVAYEAVNTEVLARLAQDSRQKAKERGRRSIH